MPRIHTIAADGTITAADKVIGSDGGVDQNFVTKNYTIGGITSFVLNGTHAGSFSTLNTTSNATIGGNLTVTGNATIAGNLTFGDADTDTVSFSADVNSHILPDATNTYNLGSSTKQWKDIYIDGTAYIDNMDILEVGPHAAVGKGSYAAYANNSVLSSTQKDYGLSIVSDADSNGYAFVSLNLGTKNNVDGAQIAYNKDAYPTFTIGMGGTTFMEILGTTGSATFKRGLSVSSNYNFSAGNGGQVYLENVNIGPQSSRYTLVNARPSSDNKFLKYTTNGATEWADVSTTGITFKGTGTDFDNSLFIGHDTTGTLNQASRNLAVGYDALKDLTSGDNNVALGYAAGENNAGGESNVFVGAQSGESVTKSLFSVYVGAFAGRLINDQGSSGNLAANNTLVGYRSGYGVAGQTTHLAVNNTAVGSETLELITTGRENAVIGAKAGEAISTGYGNVLIGFEAGKTLQTGTENIIIGTQCLNNINEGYDGIIAIGKNMGEAGINNNTTKIGHSSTVKAEILALYKTAEYANGGGNISISSSESGSIYHLNSTTDGVFTLPNTVGVGAGMQIDFVLTALPATTEHKIICNSIGANKLIGSLTIIDTDTGDATTHVAAQVSDNYIAIKLNGSTTGIVGSKIRFTSISSQKWLVEGTILVTGTPGNPFSTS